MPVSWTDSTIALERSAIRCVLTPPLSAVVAFLEVAGLAVEPPLDAVPLAPELPGHIKRAVVVVLVVVSLSAATIAMESAVRRFSVSVVVRPDFADGVHDLNSLSRRFTQSIMVSLSFISIPDAITPPFHEPTSSPVSRSNL